MAEKLAQDTPNQANARETKRLIPAAVHDWRRARATDHQTSDRKCGMSAELSTQLAILRQRLEESQAVNHWKPEPGELLLGILRGLKPAQGPFGQGHMLAWIPTQVF